MQDVHAQTDPNHTSWAHLLDVNPEGPTVTPTPTDEYGIAAITAVRKRGVERECLVHWHNYGRGQATWEREHRRNDGEFPASDPCHPANEQGTNLSTQRTLQQSTAGYTGWNTHSAVDRSRAHVFHCVDRAVDRCTRRVSLHVPQRGSAGRALNPDGENVCSTPCNQQWIVAVHILPWIEGPADPRCGTCSETRRVHRSTARSTQ